MNKPKALIKGDIVGVFVPSSPVKEPFRTEGLQKLREMGFRASEVDNILSNKGVVAKAPEEVYKEFTTLMKDDSVKALWAARGGYGSNHLLKYMEVSEELPCKVVIGSSDVSYLLWYLVDRFKMVVFYGPMLYSSVAGNKADINCLMDLVTGKCETPAYKGKTLVSGRSEGTLTGGCMTNLVSLTGTEYFPELKNRIVILEDVGERPYRLERMLWQLCESGAIDKVKGLAFGNFPGCFLNKPEKQQFLERIEQMLKIYSVPIIYDLKIGHGDNIQTVPLGCHCVIDNGNLFVTEKCVV